MTHLSRIACLAVLAAASSVQAQNVIQETTTVTTQTSPAPQMRRVSQILGSAVQLQGGAAYGKVEDIVLNDAGMVEYVLVSNEGRMVMMPWDAASMDFGKRIVTYDVTPQAVQPLSFTPDQLPTIVNTPYTNRVRQVFPQGVRSRNLPGDADKVKIKERDNKVKIKVKDRD